MSLSFQICSDLHLEFHKKVTLEHFINPSAPYLILAGDIGYPRLPSYQSFLEQASKKFQQVFLITGNHEYYGETFESAHQIITLILKNLSNIHFLNNTTYDFPEYNLVLAGTTLWSDIIKSKMVNIHQSMTDYSKIKLSDVYVPTLHMGETKLVTPSDLIKEYRKNVEWLTTVLTSSTQKRVIVITHHLPSYQLINSKYQDSPINSAFASNLEHLITSPVICWISGHTHTNIVKTINNVKCIVNPSGYPDEMSYFNRKLTYTVPILSDQSG